LNIAQTRDSLLFYIDGCLQFSSRDEYIYHETLVHPAAGILERRIPGEWKTLILGGGDGLALRETLRYQRCSGVDLVDYDPEVIERAKTSFSHLNLGAFSDNRVTVHIEDARDWIVSSPSLYDLIITDFTFPNTHGCARLFTADFFQLLKRRLHPHGLLSLNGVSPTRHTIAYWSIFRTLADVGMAPRPLHVAIPSFTDHGYGEWGFLTASPDAIRERELKGWKPAVSARFMGQAQLLDSLRFRADLTWTGFQLGNIIKAPADLLCLMDLPLSIDQVSRSLIDFSRDDGLEQIQRIVRRGGLPSVRFDPEWTARAVGILRAMDLDRLFDEVGRQLGRLSEDLREQFGKLRSELPALLKEQVLNLERAGQMVAMLMLIILFINLAYPDSAYAKGSSTSGGGGGGDIEICMFSPAPPTPFHLKPLQEAHPSHAVSMKGTTFVKRQVAAGDDPQGASPREELFYSVTDELFLTPSGHPFWCSPKLIQYYYRITPDKLSLVNDLSGTTVMTFAPDGEIIHTLLENASLQLKALEKTLEDFSKWNEWTSPMRHVHESIAREASELAHLKEIHSALTSALSLFRDYTPARPPSFTAHKLAPGVYVSTDGVLLNTKGRGWAVYSWGHYANTQHLPVLESSSVMDALLSDVLTAGQGLDPKAVQALKELKYSPLRGASKQ
jgi:spermidine synthase